MNMSRDKAPGEKQDRPQGDERLPYMKPLIVKEETLNSVVLFSWTGPQAGGMSASGAPEEE